MKCLLNKLQSFKLLALFLLVSLLPVSPALAQSINFRNYTVLDGLANSIVYHTLQDSKGFLWIATSSGVNRFDGKNFETFTTDNGLADNEVLMLHEDSKGRIWFLNFNGRLGYYFNGKFCNPNNDKTLSEAVTKASFVTCFEDSKNRLWFTTNQQQIIEIDNEKVTFHANYKGFDIANSFVFEDEQNRILAANGKSFYYLHENTISKAPSQFLPASFKSYQYDKRTKKLLFLSREGLIEFANGRFRMLRKIPENISSQDMGAFLIHKNDIWVSLATSGLYVIKPDGKTSANYLPNNIISSMMPDHDGNVWVTTLGDGLIILPAQTGNLLQYTTDTGLTDNSIYSVIKTGDGTIWLGSKSGAISFIDGQRISSLNLNTTKSLFNPIKKLEYDKAKKSVWFASSSALGEISTSDPGGKIRYLKEKNNLTFSVKSFSISKKGKIAFSLASGVYILQDKGKDLMFQTGVNLPHQVFFRDRAFKIFYDSKDRLWFSNVNGLFRLSNNKVDTLAKHSNLFSKRVTDIIELPDGNMVIGTYGYGLIILDTADRITRITIKDGLTSNICRKLAFDGKNIWLTTFSGVDKFEYKSSKRKIRTYKIKDGLTSDEVLDIYIDDHKIYLGTNEGLTILPRNEPLTKPNPPLFYITSFKVNGKPYQKQNIKELQFDQNNISVKYTAINFTKSNELYQYQLKKNGPWIQTPNTTIEFGSLEPGAYKLSVRAKTQDSEWSKPAHISFVIKPAYWQRWWFLASVYTLISLLIIGLIYIYFKTLRQKEQEKLSVQTKIIALEQRALQAMMNPHFVFNIMNSIQYFINTKDSQSANQVLTGFARLIRKNLEICTKSYISLEEEMVYLKLYLSLEKLRFGNKMTYDFCVNEEIDPEEIMIPSMLLQPFVENAIWHGIMPQEKGGSINIQVYQNNSELTVHIIDDGTGIENSKKNKKSNHVSRGMQITQDRINLLNKNGKGNISIHTVQTGDFGTKVTVKIPV